MWVNTTQGLESFVGQSSLEGLTSALKCRSWQSMQQAPGKDLEAVCHIFAYLKRHDRSRLVFDARCPNNIEQSLLDWTYFYKDTKEQTLKDTPEPLGKSIEMTSYIDSDHTGDKVTRQSRTGALALTFNLPSSVRMMECPISAIASLRGHPLVNTPCSVGAWQLVN